MRFLATNLGEGAVPPVGKIREDLHTAHGRLVVFVSVAVSSLLLLFLWLFLWLCCLWCLDLPQKSKAKDPPQQQNVISRKCHWKCFLPKGSYFGSGARLVFLGQKRSDFWPLFLENVNVMPESLKAENTAKTESKQQKFPAMKHMSNVNGLSRWSWLLGVSLTSGWWIAEQRWNSLLFPSP